MSGFETTQAVLQTNASAAAANAQLRWYVLAMVDLSHFSELAATLPVRDIFGLLDFFYEEAGRIAARRNGIIKKRVGDAIVVAFPADQPSVSLAAVSDAVEFSGELINLVSRLFDREIGAKAALSAGILCEGEFTDGHMDLAGNALTTLFRLEGCARQGTILMPSHLLAPTGRHIPLVADWQTQPLTLQLKGVREQAFTEVIVDRLPPHTEASEALADTAINAIQAADSHASRLGALSIALVALSYRYSGPAFDRDSDGESLLLGLFLCFVFVAVALSAAVLWPRIDPGQYIKRAPGEWSPTFFGDVPPDYTTFRGRSVTRSALEVDRARQAYIVARIAKQKAHLLRFGTLFFGMTLAMLVLLLVQVSRA